MYNSAFLRQSSRQPKPDTVKLSRKYQMQHSVTQRLKYSAAYGAVNIVKKQHNDRVTAGWADNGLVNDGQ